MDNYGFTHYYGKHKRRGVQRGVVQSRKLQFRMSGDLLKKFEKYKSDYEITNESELIKDLLDESIESRNQEAWEAEVKEW